MTGQALSAGDDHEVIHLGGEVAVVVPLAEYRLLKLTHDWHRSPGPVRTGPEEFLAVSGLSADDQQLLRDRYGLGSGPR